MSSPDPGPGELGRPFEMREMIFHGSQGEPRKMSDSLTLPRCPFWSWLLSVTLATWYLTQVHNSFAEGRATTVLRNLIHFTFGGEGGLETGIQVGRIASSVIVC